MPTGHYKKRKIPTKLPPAAWCLQKPDLILPIMSQLEERCPCPKTNGQWCVVWGKRVYFILPPTQLQKDLWLGEAQRTVKRDVALNALRWYCHGCGNIQRP